MPLYELFVISPASALNQAPLARLMKSTAELVLQTPSTVLRRIEYLGTRALPYRIKADDKYHHDGSYWLMQFYAGPAGLDAIRSELAYNRSILRFTLTKEAQTLKHLIR